MGSALSHLIIRCCSDFGSGECSGGPHDAENGLQDACDSQAIGVSAMASAKMASAIDVRIDDAGSILKFRIGFPFGEHSAGFCQSVWLPESMLNFRIGSVSSKRGVDCRDRISQHHFRFPEARRRRIGWRALTGKIANG